MSGRRCVACNVRKPRSGLSIVDGALSAAFVLPCGDMVLTARDQEECLKSCQRLRADLLQEMFNRFETPPGVPKKESLQAFFEEMRTRTGCGELREELTHMELAIDEMVWYSRDAELRRDKFPGVSNLENAIKSVSDFVVENFVWGPNKDLVLGPLMEESLSDVVDCCVEQNGLAFGFQRVEDNQYNLVFIRLLPST